MKGHIDRGDGKGLCGSSIPSSFDPWSSGLESCQRCVDAKARAAAKFHSQARAKAESAEERGLRLFASALAKIEREADKLAASAIGYEAAVAEVQRLLGKLSSACRKGQDFGPVDDERRRVSGLISAARESALQNNRVRLDAELADLNKRDLERRQNMSSWDKELERMR